MCSLSAAAQKPQTAEEREARVDDRSSEGLHPFTVIYSCGAVERIVQVPQVLYREGR